MTTSSPVTYELDQGIATITMDDGKANVQSLPMMSALNEALDRAESDEAVVVLRGRAEVFSAGYDRGLFSQPAEEILLALRTGGNLVHRMLGFPRPILAACPGHAIAQGAFLLLGADVRFGVSGDFKIGLNEVSIGLTIPYYGIEAARHRLSPAWFNHATTTGTLYGPGDAKTAGFLDEVIDPLNLDDAIEVEAEYLRDVDNVAHAATKLRVRRDVLDAMRAGIDTELRID